MKRWNRFMLFMLALTAPVAQWACTPSDAAAQVETIVVTAARRLIALDAEEHLGLQAGEVSEAVAALNTARLNAALASMHPEGDFDAELT